MSRTRNNKKDNKLLKSKTSGEAAHLRQIGLAMKNSSREAEAIAPLKEALRMDNSLADVHFALASMANAKPFLKIDIDEINKSIRDKQALHRGYDGILDVLIQRRQYKEAVLCAEELNRLKPNDPQILIYLGRLLNLIGEPEKASLYMARAVNCNPQNKVMKGLFCTSIQDCIRKEFQPEIRQAVLECFKDIYDVNLLNFGYSWVGLMMVDPVFKEFIKVRSIVSEEDFFRWANSLDTQTGAFLSDPYLSGGLRILVMTDHMIESVLTRLRRYICLFYDSLVANGRIVLFKDFLPALAEQCFFNEYVWAQDSQEAEIAASLATQGDRDAICLSACYHPLYKTFKGRGAELHALSKDDIAFRQMVKTQLADYIVEQKLKEEIPVFGAFTNEISKAVREQYEENPYPRWTTLTTIPLPNDDLIFDESKRNLPFKILVAGCGTGRHAISTAVRYPKSHVTAIDLSRASLAYAMRKAQECGMTDRIDFVHADILSMKNWDDEFDMIECSGVLHHMEDPFLGWKTLSEKLKPNGCIKIGLYSAIARQAITMTREFIAGNGYPSTTEGIRACRRDIFNLPTTDIIRQAMIRSPDFYTTSLVRDLIFHVQEHQMTLPQIRDMMDRLNLTCFKFLITNPKTLAEYDRIHPDDTRRASFENWEAFEKKRPLTFAGMYQFWAQKQKL